MPSRWSTLVMDEGSLRDLPGLPPEAVLHHADEVIATRPGPVELYRRWERQQWSAVEIELGPDGDALAGLPRPTRRLVEDTITTFVVGEYTGMDMLGPLVVGSPDEQYSTFLATQLADEARHTHLMFRLGEEVLGLDPEPRRMLAQAWERSSPAHRELALLEGRLMRELHDRPLDYRRWLRASVVFHLITEGVLALVGQRVVVQSLRALDVMPGMRTAFTAMCRDESRHVGFGMTALRTGILEGHEQDICEVLAEAVPIALGLGGELTVGRADFRAMSIDTLRRHLRAIGIEEGFAEHLLAPYAHPERVA